MAASGLDVSLTSAFGAVGLVVPGSGSTVTRAGALAALEHGRVRNALLGGVPGGKPLIHVRRAIPRAGRGSAAIVIYVVLPPPGRHPNTRRYPIAVVGGGYRGLLTSEATRIPGLVSIADVAPAAIALEHGRRPRLRWRADAGAAATLARLDQRVERAHAVRGFGTLILVALTLAYCALDLLFRSSLLARAAVLVAPAALSAALVLSAAGVSRPAAVRLALALAAGAGSVAAAALLRSRGALAAGLAAFLCCYFAVLGTKATWNSLAAIGPHPDGGGRFYGITNEVETLLLVPALLTAALLGLRSLPLVAIVVAGSVGISRIGADGGGLLVFALGFLVLAVRLSGVSLTIRRLALIAAVAAGLSLAVVGLDAALGGSTHVTHAVGAGPDSLAGELAHRIHLSALRTVSSWVAGSVVLGFIGVLILFATFAAPSPVGDALLVAIAASLLVNDAPTDVAGFGALGFTVAWIYERGTQLAVGDRLSTLASHAPPRPRFRRLRPARGVRGR